MTILCYFELIRLRYFNIAQSYYDAMTKIISFVTQKGGSGKTTLCVNFAVAAMQSGNSDCRVLIMDTDQQGTAQKWFERRESAEPLLLPVSNTADIERAVVSARAQKFDWVFIDTPGRDDAAVAAAIRLADFCVIPTRPSSADLEATPATRETVSRLEKPFAFVLTQTPPRSFRITDAIRGLSLMGMVCPHPIVSRMAFQDAQTAGQSVLEYEIGGRAGEDIKNSWTWLVEKIRKVNYGKETARA